MSTTDEKKTTDANENHVKHISSLSEIEKIEKTPHEMNNLRLLLPTGRRPLKLIPGCEYDLDEDVYENEDEENIAMETDAKENIKLRLESYQMNSFVCENGYLSEDELVTTPTVNWRKERENKIKSQKASERKRWKLRLKSFDEPEIINNIDPKKGKGKKAQLKKFQALVFSVNNPVQTGKSIEADMLKCLLTSPAHYLGHQQGLCDEDVDAALHLAQIAMSSNNNNPVSPGHETKMTIDENKNTEVDAHEIEKAEESVGDAMETDHKNLAELSETCKVEETEDTKPWSIEEKYKLKYLIKEQAKILMTRSCAVRPGSAEILLRELVKLDPILMNKQDKKLSVKYATKYFYKFLHQG